MVASVCCARAPNFHTRFWSYGMFFNPCAAPREQLRIAVDLLTGESSARHFSTITGTITFDVLSCGLPSWGERTAVIENSKDQLSSPIPGQLGALTYGSPHPWVPNRVRRFSAHPRYAHVRGACNDVVAIIVVAIAVVGGRRRRRLGGWS